MNADSPSPARRDASAGRGLAYMAQSAFWFAVMALLVKLAGARGLPTMQIVLVRALVTLSLSVLGLWHLGLGPRGERTGLLLLRGVFGSGGLICFYLAVAHLPLAEATVVHQLSPLLTAPVATLWLGERFDRRVLVGMLCAFAGVVLIARPISLFASPAPGSIAWPFVLVGLLGALFASFAYVAVRRLGRTEPAARVVFYFPLVTVPLSAPFAIADWRWPDANGWCILLGVGLSTQIAQLAMTRGLAREPAGRATAIGYLQVAFATLFGMLVFGAVPGIASWLGMAAIAAGIWLATRR